MGYEAASVNAGSGIDVAVDTVGGKMLQVNKLDLGGDGVSLPLVGVDVDTGAGTDVAMPVAIRFPASGGGVSAPGDAANGMDVDVTRLPALTMAANAQSDGHSVTLGSTGDAAVIGDTAGSVSGKLRGLGKLLNDVWDTALTALKVVPTSRSVNGTISAVSGNVVLNTSGMGSAIVTITGNLDGTLAFSGRVATGGWYGIWATELDVLGVGQDPGQPTASGNGTFLLPVAGTKEIKVEATARNSGTATVDISASPGSQMMYLAEALPPGSNSIGYVRSAISSQADGHSLTLGAQADAEATGNGSVIAILKRIRTLLAGPVPVSQGTAATATGGWPIRVSDGATLINVGDSPNSAVRVNVVADSSGAASGAATAADSPPGYTDGQSVPLMVDLQGRLSVQQDDIRRVLETLLVALTTDERAPLAAARGARQRVVRRGSDPPVFADGLEAEAPVSRHALPYTIGGHPNIVSMRFNFTAAQTNTVLVAVPSGWCIVVTRLMVTLDKAVTATGVSVIIGTGQAATPTTTGVIGSHPNIDPGGGFVCGDGSGILGDGNDGEDLFITSGVPTSGSLDGVVTYYIEPC